MKHRWLAALLLILFNTISVHAQNTNVSATVTDSNSVIWANGKYTFNFIPNPRFQSGPYFNNGISFTPVSISGNLDGTGSLTSVAVPSNSTTTPSGTQWTVTYCPQATAPCQTSNPITITGASQNITSSFTPSALTIAPGPGVLVYNTNEVPVAALGAQVFIIGTGQQFCTAVTGTSCTTWGGSGGITQGAWPGYNTINVCGPPYNASCDTQLLTNQCTITTSSTVTCPTGTFVSTDTGKVAQATSASCTPNQGYTSTIILPEGTITFVDSAHVTSTQVGTTTTSVNCFAFGHKDDVAWTAAETAGNALFGACPLYQVGGRTWWDAPHMFLGNSLFCGTWGAQASIGQGPAIIGIAKSVSGIFLSGTFGANIATNCTHGISNNSCVGGITGQVWQDLTILGGTNSLNSAGAPSINLFECNTCFIRDVTLTGFGHSSNGPVGFVCCSVNGGVAYDLIVDAFGRGNFLNAGSLTLGASTFCDDINGELTGTGSAILSSKGGNAFCINAGQAPTALDWSGDSGNLVLSPGDSIGCNGACGANAVGIRPGSGVIVLNGSTIDMSSVSTGLPFFTVSGSGTIRAANSILKAGSGTAIAGGGGTETFVDSCGNTIVTGTSPAFSGVTVQGTCTTSQSAINRFVTSRNTAVSSTTLIAAGNNLGVDPIRVTLYAYDSAAGASCTGNTTVTWTISYTDPTNTVQTQTATETITTNGGATGGDKLQTQFVFSPNPGTAVTYSTTYAAGTGCVTNPSYAAQLGVI